MRCALSFSLLAAVSIAVAQEIAKPITYTTKAKPCRIVVDEIAKQSGLKLKVARELEEEPVILRLDKVPAKRVLDKIAEVFVGEWVDHRDYLQLERDEEKLSAIRLRLFEQRVADIKADVDSYLKRQGQAPAFDDATAEALVRDYIALEKKQKIARTPETDKLREQLDSRLPGKRLGVSLLALMDARELASIEENRRVVFSTSPTAMQRPLPAFEDEIFTRFLDERRVFRKAVEKLKPSFNADSVYRNMDLDLEPGIQGNSEPINSRPARVLVVTERYGKALGLTFSLLDEGGKVIATDNEVVADLSMDKRLERRAKRAQLFSETVKNGISLSPLVRELTVRYLSQGPAEHRPLDANALKALTEPTVCDPLSLTTSETLIGSAEKAGLNLVALASDETELYAMACSVAGRVSLERLATALVYSSDEMTIGEGWLVFRPYDPAKAAELRVPRPLLEGLVKSVYAEKGLSLDVAASFRSQLPRPVPATVYAAPLELLLGRDSARTFYSDGTDALRFFGSLSDDECEAAKRRGYSTTFANLSDQQKSILNDFVFENYANFKVPSADSADGFRWTELEQTDVLPNGIPTGTKVTVSDESTLLAYPLLSINGSPQRPYAQKIDGIAYMIVRHQHPEVMPKGYTQEVTSWNKGHQRQVRIVLDFGVNVVLEKLLVEDHPEDKRDVTLEQFLSSLPDEMRLKLLREADQLYKSMLAAGMAKDQPVPGRPPS